MSDIYAIVFMAVFAGFLVGIVFAPRPKRKRKRKRKNDEMPKPFGRVRETLRETPDQHIMRGMISRTSIRDVYEIPTHDFDGQEITERKIYEVYKGTLSWSGIRINAAYCEVCMSLVSEMPILRIVFAGIIENRLWCVDLIDQWEERAADE